MGFPKIEHCIVCDGVREETRNKITILGFLGLSPDAIVALDKFPATVNLTFLFAGGSGSGTHMVGFQVERDGFPLPLFTAPPQPMDIGQSARAMLIAQFPINFPAPGKYRIKLIADGKERAAGRFSVASM